MTTTTHIAVSCFITALSIPSPVDNSLKAVIVSAGALFAHFLLDAVPHGFIAKPATLFKEIIPTLAELVPGPLVLITAIWLFGNPLLFLLAASFGILPDVISTLYYKKKNSILSIPLLPYIHALHRRVHWFETEHPDGSCSCRFPTTLLLAGEALFTCCYTVCPIPVKQYTRSTFLMVTGPVGREHGCGFRGKRSFSTSGGGVHPMGGTQAVLSYEPAPALLFGIARICPTSSLVDGNWLIDCSAFVVVPNLFAIFQSESPFLNHIRWGISIEVSCLDNRWFFAVAQLRGWNLELPALFDVAAIFQSVHRH